MKNKKLFYGWLLAVIGVLVTGVSVDFHAASCLTIFILSATVVFVILIPIILFFLEYTHFLVNTQLYEEPSEKNKN